MLFPPSAPRAGRVLAAAMLALALPWGALAGPAGAGSARDAGPFAGLGTWVDAFDYAPAFQTRPGPVAVTPESVGDMAALGVRTLHLQAAMNDSRSPGRVVDERLVGEILVRAHREGMNVVAWYYPSLADLGIDVAHVRALANFRYRGQRFDGLALDMEATQSVRDTDERNERLVALAEKTRELAGDRLVGAIVYPAVQLEMVNPALWPRFPYKQLAKWVDVWLPMVYWTFRDGPYRDPYAYTAESVARLRDHLGDTRVMVHPIGGIGDQSTAEDYRAFLRAVRESRSVGWSIYDFNTTMSSAWPRLRTRDAPTAVTTTSTTTTTTPPEAATTTPSRS